MTRSNKPQPPGNSLFHIDAAYELGYDGVELDVQLSKDDVLVLMHNHTIDDTTLRQGRVNEFTAEELRRIQLKDPWNGSSSYIESLEAALRLNGARGPVMVDQHHTVPRTVAALKRSVEQAAFDPAQLLLLTYTRDGGFLLKETFPDALVLLKAPHNLHPPKLTASFANEAVGLDAVLVPTANFNDVTRAFRAETTKLGLKLAIYMHDSNLESLLRIMETKADYVTSFVPEVFRAAREKYPLI